MLSTSIGAGVFVWWKLKPNHHHFHIGEGEMRVKVMYEAGKFWNTVNVPMASC